MGAGVLFLAFAFAYFLSALLRAVTATLAPAFSAELGLGAGQLGLLAGAYFLGFASLQLPLGTALDRYGPKRVLLSLLAVAACACAGFAVAASFGGLLVARALIGVGVGACLMAPMTFFRRRFSPSLQLRLNSWLLMTGSLGMVASTLPVQWLLPTLGWRGLFWALAALLVAGMLLIALVVPPDDSPGAVSAGGLRGYAQVFSHPSFVRLAPMAFFHYGGLIAVQALWAGPWLTQVSGWNARDAARGLFAINLAMLLAFLGWGMVMPRLVARGWQAERLIAYGVPVSLALLALAIGLGPSAGALSWAAWCVSCTVVSLSQTTVAQAVPTPLAGRALTGFNLVIFLGVFCMQWGIGVAVDALLALGLSVVSAFRSAFAIFGVGCAAGFAWFLLQSPRRRAAAEARG